MDLNNLYDELISGKKSVEEVSEIMKSSDMKKKTYMYLHRDLISKNTPYNEEELHEIEMILKITQYIYNNSGMDTGLTDSEYDGLYSIIIANDGSDDTSAPIVPNSKNLTTHKYPSLRGTLAKIYYLNDNDETRTNPNRKSLMEWAASMQNKLYQSTGSKVNLLNEEVFVFPKFDGVSAIFELDEDGNILRVLTRGFTETNEAQDITRHFQHLEPRAYHEFGKGVKYGLKTEIMMANKDLDYYNKTYRKNYKNTRSIVSAILNSDTYDPDKSRLLKIVPLRVGDIDGNQKLAREVMDFPYMRCRLKDTDVIKKFAFDHRYVFDELRCDGAVIYIINESLQKKLGRENNKNNFEVAYKFTEETAFSKLLDIEYRVGLFGRIAPVAKIKPVVMKGNTIDTVSLGSIGRVRDLQLRKGDKVKILYDIIPYLQFDEDCEHNKKHYPFELPMLCPSCKQKLEYSDSGDIATCVNPGCSYRIKGKILNYLNKMNIDNISYGIIDKLYEEGYVKDILDLYKIKDNFDEISNISGFGKISVQTWIDEIESHMVVPDYVVLGSIGIEGISKKTFEKIMNVFDIEDLFEITDNMQVGKLCQVEGIKMKSAEKIINGIYENKQLIQDLDDILTILASKGRVDISKFSVAFTNIRDEEKEKFILLHGGRIDDSLTKKTTFLVVPTLNTESTKVDKAKKYGIPIIHIDDIEAKIAEYVSSH